MQNRIIYLIILLFLTLSCLSAQDRITDNYKLTGLSNTLLESEVRVFDTLKTSFKDSKSPVLSGLLSLVLPGAGHFYTDRMDVGAYFLGADAVLWLGLFGVNYYAGIIKDDSRSYASQHAGLDVNGKDDDYFSNVGSYLNIYNYNNEKLQAGEYDKMYDINTYFWNWDSPENQSEFEKQRKRSERTYNISPVIVTGLILNRLVSALSSVLLTNKHNETGGVRIQTELTKTAGNRIDGIKLNFVKSF
ncbi:MAG: hypothetical protein MUE56_05065 [Ignavibacteria bacterium]|jgi:hypothetical protein|nr:hypothetical protein [Ignavibacteria bacterium]